MYAQGGGRSDQLGILPAVSAVVSIAHKIPFVPSILKIKTSKDPERLAHNQEAYGRALAGDRPALDFLKLRSGRFGSAMEVIAGYESLGPIGPWATDKAKNDAFQKYTAALQAVPALASTPPGMATTPPVAAAINGALGGNLPLVLAGAAVLFMLRGGRGRR